MNSVLTLVASEQGGLSPLNIKEISAELQGGDEPVWLSENTAVDVFCQIDKDDYKSVADSIRKKLESLKIDVFLNPAEGRKKKLLIADMDATIVQGETLDELAGWVDGAKEKIEAITAKAMAGELDFEAALRERVGMLKGLSESALEECWGQMKLMSGAETFVKTMRENGAKCCLVSGGFTFFTQKVADLCNFHANFGNQLGVENSALTGEVVGRIVGKETKLNVLQQESRALDLPLNQTLAIGDGANDLAMLTAAGLGIGYHGKQLVLEQTVNQINFGDLTSALYAQGYQENDFVK